MKLEHYEIAEILNELNIEGMKFDNFSIAIEHLEIFEHDKFYIDLMKQDKGITLSSSYNKRILEDIINSYGGTALEIKINRNKEIRIKNVPLIEYDFQAHIWFKDSL